MVERVENLIERAPAARAPALLGVWAEAKKLDDDLEAAYGALYHALELETTDGGQAQLLLRLAAVEANRTSHHRALVLARRAKAKFELARDPEGLGKALVSEAIWVSYLGFPKLSLRLARAGLRWFELAPELGTRAPYFLVAAHECAARNHLALGDRPRAGASASRALEHATGCGPLIEGKALWLRAALLREDRPDEALELLREAIEKLSEASPIDAALAYVDLLTLSPLEPGETAAELIEISERLKRYKIASAAVLKLVNLILEGRDLSLSVLSATRSSIVEARARSWKRAPRK